MKKTVTKILRVLLACLILSAVVSCAEIKVDNLEMESANLNLPVHFGGNLGVLSRSCDGSDVSVSININEHERDLLGISEKSVINVYAFSISEQAVSRNVADLTTPLDLALDKLQSSIREELAKHLNSAIDPKYLNIGWIVGPPPAGGIDHSDLDAGDCGGGSCDDDEAINNSDGNGTPTRIKGDDGNDYIDANSDGCYGNPGDVRVTEDGEVQINQEGEWVTVGPDSKCTILCGGNDMVAIVIKGADNILINKYTGKVDGGRKTTFYVNIPTYRKLSVNPAYDGSSVNKTEVDKLYDSLLYDLLDSCEDIFDPVKRFNNDYGVVEITYNKLVIDFNRATGMVVDRVNHLLEEHAKTSTVIEL